LITTKKLTVMFGFSKKQGLIPALCFFLTYLSWILILV